jgi:hypothetical protein
MLLARIYPLRNPVINSHGALKGVGKSSDKIGKPNSVSSNFIFPPELEIEPVIPAIDSGAETVNRTLPLLSDSQFKEN